MSEFIKRTVRVIIEKEVEIELTPAVFGGMTEEEYLAEFRRCLWHVDGIDDVVEYAAGLAATNGSGFEWDGIGLLGESYSTFPRVPDVKFNILSDNMETEIVGGAA